MYKLYEQSIGLTLRRTEFSSFAAALDYFLDHLEYEKKDAECFARSMKAHEKSVLRNGKAYALRAARECGVNITNDYVEIYSRWVIENNKTGGKQVFPYLKRCYKNGVVTLKNLPLLIQEV